MQRLTHDDLAGEMDATGEYTTLRLPMRYEADFPCRTKWGGDRRTIEGELLFSKRFPPQVVDNLEKFEMTPVVFAAQCQQRPQVQGGGIFKREWYRFWHWVPGIDEPCLCEECWKAERVLPGHKGPRECTVCPESGEDIQSWDLTFKRTDSSDFVSGQVWRVVNAASFLMDLLNQRLSFVETKQAFRDMSNRWPTAYTKLVEDKANGPAIEDDLKNDIPGITLVNPAGGKPARANSASTCYHAGMVFLPHPLLMPKVWAYMKQHEGFPKAANDDMVDAGNQHLIRTKNGSAAWEALMKKIRGE